VNPWIRRSAGVVVLSTGLAVAGSVGAQAAEPRPVTRTSIPASYFMVPGSAFSGVGNTFNNSTNQQAGLVALNITTNIQIGASNAGAGGFRMPFELLRP
jgi:hypothetical protein